MIPAALDVEAALTAWLFATLQVRTVTETPADLAGALPLLEVVRIGGTTHGRFVDEAIVDVTAYDATRQAARELAYRAGSALRFQLPSTQVTGGVVLRVDIVSAPAWHPHDNTGLRRFGATYAITTQPRS